MDLPDPVTYAIPAFVALVAAEMLVAWARDKRRYEAKDTLTSLADVDRLLQEFLAGE